MRNFFSTDSEKPRPFAKAAAVLAAAVILSSCGGDTGTKASTGGAASEAGLYTIENDHIIGNADAKVTIVEHASVMCGACRNWHEAVYPDFKKKYIDTGLVRFIFREFPTPPENLAQAGFLIANCAGDAKFFDNIKLQFKRQPQVFKAMQNGTVLQEYVAIGKAGGLSEEETMACLRDEAQIAKYEAKVQNGIDNGVTSTPSFFMNGEKLDRTSDGKQFFLMNSFDEALAPILGAEATKADEPADEAKPE